METFLIFRQLKTDEIVALKQQLDQKDRRVFYLPGLISKDDFEGYDLNILPSEIIRSANQNLLKEMLAFGDTPGKESTVSELLNIDGLPLWHYQRFRIFHRLQATFQIRYALKYFEEQNNRIICYCNQAKTDFSDLNNTDIHFITSDSPSASGKNYTGLLYYSIFFIIRVLISILLPPRNRNKKHLIIDRSFKQYCRHLLTLEPKQDNYNLSHLFDLSEDDFLIISEVEPPKTSGIEKFRLQKEFFSGQGRRSKTLYGEYILFRGLMSPSVHSLRKKKIRELQRISKLIGSELNTKEQELIFNAFIGLSSTNSFFILKHLAYKRFFNRNKFKTIAAIDENSPATRCILDAARLNGSITIGIQHGNISDSHPAYLYSELDQKNKVMADLTLVWGSYWKNFLETKGNFRADSIIITGQMRTDLIPRLLPGSSAFKARFTNKPKLIVFASQPIPDKSMRWQAAFDVFTVFAETADTELIVKLHPAERGAIAYYSEIAGQAGYKNLKFLYDVDLYELIAACDLLITCYSTVGGEAVYMGKPLIILDHHKSDLLGYHAEGVAWQATDATSLMILAKKILQNELSPDKNKYEEFISKYAYTIDGNATRRCLNAIRSVESDISR
jgi:hypothetical protein